MVRSGRARVVVPDHLGRPKELTLPALYNSDESLRENERVLGILRVHRGKLPPAASGLDMTLNELVVLFIERKVEAEYVDADGKPTGDQDCQREAIRPLLRLVLPFCNRSRRGLETRRYTIRCWSSV